MNQEISLVKLSFCKLIKPCEGCKACGPAFLLSDLSAGCYSCYCTVASLSLGITASSVLTYLQIPRPIRIMAMSYNALDCFAGLMLPTCALSLSICVHHAMYTRNIEWSQTRLSSSTMCTALTALRHNGTRPHRTSALSTDD